MRRLMAGIAALTAVTVGASLAAPAALAAPTGQQAAGTRQVSYHDYQVAVPASWRVIDIAADPRACVQFDLPTVYLGRPGDQSDCPTSLAGRTAGLVIEPMAGASADRLAAAVGWSPGQTAVPVSRDHTIQLAVPDAGVLVTAAHAPDNEQLIRRILGTATVTADAVSVRVPDLSALPVTAAGGTDTLPASAAAISLADTASDADTASNAADASNADTAGAAATTAAALAAAGPQPGTYVGKGFDTCAAPTQSTMNAWRNSSPYRAVGIYISGASRSCAQPNLTANWVTNQTANGWRLIPIELGRQAPCGTRLPKMSANPATAKSEGSSAATSAVNAAQALGIGRGSAIYNDMEQYPTNASCKAAVLSYLTGWTERLHTLGYLSGMYSSGSSGVRDVCSVYHDSTYARLDHLWIAWWNGVANTDAGQYCPSDYYADHQRLHQYAGDVYETWGGVQIRIDRNYLDVSTGVSEPPPTSWSTIIDNTTAGRFTASANWGVSSYSTQRYGADYRFADPVASSDVAWYKANIPATASYEISVWYPASDGYNDSTPFIIAANGGNQTVRVNQRLNGGQWVSLGVYPLAAGDGDKVGVSRWTSGVGYVLADAVRITRV